MNVEGRDWLGNPDGTLVYWQQETDELRRRIQILREEMDSNEMWTIQKSVVRRILDLPRNIEVEEPA